MARLLRKKRTSLVAVILPTALLLLLGIMSVGVFPGWVRPVYGTPGDSCSTDNPNDCDACNLETCVNNPPFGLQCQNGDGSFSPTASPTPFCPNVAEAPGCWTTCNEVPNGNGIEEAICSPNDNFCQDISGGDQSNECRAAVCVDFNPNEPFNISGCEYTLDTDQSTECRNCLPEGLATLENCGNGICEPDEGEACNTCSIDCLIPGFEETCPLTTGIIIRQACQPIPGITFDGPPYNVPGSTECEDGDLCTDNACSQTAGDVCDVTPKSCEPDADFCCPAGCAAPTGDSCREVTGAPIPGCDPDCYVPEDCVPTPTPPPVFAGCLQGSGLSGEKGGPGCGGFACSLNTAETLPSHGMALALLASLGLMGLLSLRKRHG